MKCAQFILLFEKFMSGTLTAKICQTKEYADWCEHLDSCSGCRDCYEGKIVEDRGFAISDFPCVHIAYHTTNKCEKHKDPWECPDHTLVRSRRGREFGIPVRDGGSSMIVIEFCPCAA